MSKILGKITTVGELKEYLKNIPDEFECTPYGDPDCSAALDEKNKRLYIDNTDYLSCELK